jgi:hypothetical protein
MRGLGREASAGVVEDGNFELGAVLIEADHDIAGGAAPVPDRERASDRFPWTRPM